MVKPKFTKATMRGGMAFLQRARNAIDGGFMHRPSWFDVAVQHQPTEPPKAHRGNLAPVEYPEDRLMKVISKKHPELWLNTIVNLIPDGMGHIHYKHPAALFLERQKQYMAAGQSEEEAYQAVVEDWKRQRRFEKIELQVAMVQASELGAVPEEDENGPRSPWELRRDQEFQEALTRRIATDQQKRRERLEALLEARDATGETEPVDVTTLDPDISQQDVDALLATDERAERHFGGGPSTFDITMERLLPEAGTAQLDKFKKFLDSQLTPQVRALLDASEMPSEGRAKFFKKYDAVLAERQEARLAAERAQEEQALRDRAEAGEDETGGEMDDDLDDDDDDGDEKKKKTPAKGAVAAKGAASKAAPKTVSKKKKKD